MQEHDDVVPFFPETPCVELAWSCHGIRCIGIIMHKRGCPRFAWAGGLASVCTGQLAVL